MMRCRSGSRICSPKLQDIPLGPLHVEQPINMIEFSSTRHTIALPGAHAEVVLSSKPGVEAATTLPWVDDGR